MSKNISISEGHQGRTFTNVKRIKTNLTGSDDKQFWIPEDEAGQYANLIDKTITENGEYLPSQDNCDGYKSVNVNVGGASLGTKDITSNGTYNATDDGYDGYSSVDVRVPIEPGSTGHGTAPDGAKVNYATSWISIAGFASPSLGLMLSVHNT